MATTPTQAAKDLVSKLKGTWHGAYGKACCPAHADRSPSLSITPGDKAVLFHCFAGCSQAEIIDALRRLGDLPKPTERDTSPATRADRAQLCRDLWNVARPLTGTPAQKYLDARAIGHSKIGKYAPAAVTIEKGKRLRLPALYLPIIERREIIALARVFLDSSGQKNPRLDEPKRTLGDPRGGAIQIGLVEGDHLNLAEGFEEAESVIAMHELPGCWSVNGTEQYARLSIPDHIRSITIYSQHGKAASAGVTKAEANLTANNRTVSIVLPPPGGDWNDARRAQI
jgi:hypothetical protein